LNADVDGIERQAHKVFGKRQKADEQRKYRAHLT
jgi:hypothetical protein